MDVFLFICGGDGYIVIRPSSLAFSLELSQRFRYVGT